MFEWFWRKVFSEERVGYLIEKAKPFITNSIKVDVKDMIFDLMEDEDIALGVKTYGDALFERYKKKVWGTIGGLQKGVNAATLKGKQQLGILDDEGNISLGNIMRMAMSGQLKGLMSGAGSSPSAASPSSRRVEIRSQ